jgi:FkbM family methyltransferase
MSQYGQDDWVLQTLGGRRGGYFLDSGASDGVSLSNTLRLEREYGWTGLLVEPNPLYFADLVKNRTSDCVRCCLWHEDGEAEFLPAGMLGGLVQTMGEEGLARAFRDENLPAGTPTVKVPTRSTFNLLRDSGAPPVIDYWSLDVEGAELEVLHSFPWDKYRVLTLTVEHNYRKDREEVRRFLAPLGLGHVESLGCDDCYRHEILAAKE